MSHNLALLSLSLLFACDSSPVPESTVSAPSGGSAVGDYMAQRPKSAPHGGASSAPSTGLDGVVVQTMNSGGYTYVEVDHCGKKTWMAGPEVSVKVGDTVWAPAGAAMPGFKSNTLNRTFDQIDFVSAIEPRALPVDCSGGTSSASGASSAAPAPAASKVKAFAPAEGVLTLKELYEQAPKLNGEVVSVQGEVTKFNANIMKTNWLHLQDGTGSAEQKNNDLTVTTSEVFAVGQRVILSGTVGVDRDFGAGYRYALIVEKASSTGGKK